MKFNIEIECTDNSKVTEEKLYGYVLRAIASVVANNSGIITSMSCTQGEDKTDRKRGIVSDDDVCEWKHDAAFKFAKSECGAIDTHRIDFKKLKFCPYCGKKIKVVE